MTPNPGVPLFGEVAQSQALKLANAGSNDELLPFEVNGFWGLLNQNGRAIALPRVDWTDVGIDGLARFTLDGKTGFMLGNGEWRFAPTYRYADRFEEDYAVFGDGEKFGYLDKAGKVRLSAELDAALRFREGYAGVRVGDRCGFINTRFQLATPLKFTAVRSFHEGLAAVRWPAEDSAADATNPAVPETADASAKPRGQRARGVWGFINKNGRQLFRDTAATIEALGDFNDGMARFQSGGKWGYLDRQFRVVAGPTFEEARDFTQGAAAVKKDGRWGYVNRRFDVVVPFIYDRADDFDETLAMVTLGGQVGFIGRSGRVVIEPQFDAAEPFRLGVARVQTGESFGYLKASGHILYDPRQAQVGIVDTTRREQLRTQESIRRPANRVLRPPPRRPVLPRPYPPEYQYDEGLWAGSPPGPVETPPVTPPTDALPGNSDPEPAERI